MCLIVDANVAGEIVSSPDNLDISPVRQWLSKGGGMLVFGGKLGRELKRSRAFSRYLASLVRAGRAYSWADQAVDEEESRIQRQCRSDDAHVIALARLSGARTLFSRDRQLHADFGNPALVARPRGRIYQCRAHVRLLRHEGHCPGRARRGV